MRLLCDEDIGTRVPTALTLVGCAADSMHQVGWRGRDDVDWIPDAAAEGYLVFSTNKRMLLNTHEREAIVTSGLGIVYLTHGEERLRNVLLLLLRKWAWLERIAEGPKPFAYFLYPTGRVTSRHRLRNGIALSL